VLCASCAISLIGVELIVRQLQPALLPYNTSHYPRVEKGFGAVGRCDIVLMGSSRVRFGLDPAVFEQVLGHSSHNVGVSNSRVVEWNVFARRLFGDAPPRVVVVGINAWEVDAHYLPTEAALQLFTFDDYLESLRVDGPSLDVVGAYARRAVGPFWKTFDARFELLNWGQERLAFAFPKHAQLARELRERATEPRAPSGYDHPWSHGRRLKNLAEKIGGCPLEVAEEPPPAHRPDAFTYMRLENLFDWFAGRGIRVIVAYIPNSPRTEARWKKVEPAMTARIAEVCRASGVPFLHWTPAQLPRSNEDYLDETHVGWPLACEISRRIAEQIEALALLDDIVPHNRLASKEVEP
jgi:hypothetical protein